MYSLKRHNPEACIKLIIDSRTKEQLSAFSQIVHDYADEIVLVETPDWLSTIQKSRYIKTRLPHYLNDNFLYLDNDTIVTGSLRELETFEYEVAAVLNRHMNGWNRENPNPSLREYYKMTRLHPSIDNNIAYYFNGGVIFCKNSTKSKAFFDTWHKLWWESSVNGGYHKDQPDMWRANVLHSNIIAELDGKYNCQLIYPENSLQYILDARVMHYFSSTPYLMKFPVKQEEPLSSIKTRGITPEIEMFINNAKSVYLSLIRGLSDDETRLYDSPLVILARKISRDFPWSNKLARGFYRIFGIKI